MELILVLVLVATLTTLATPTLSGFARRAALEDTGNALLSLTQRAQTRAVHEAITHRVVFDLEQREARLEVGAGESDDDDAGDIGVEAVTWDRSIAVTSDIETSGFDRFTINFEPSGLVTPGGIVLEQEGRFIALSCDAATDSYRIYTPSELTGRTAEGVLDAARR